MKSLATRFRGLNMIGVVTVIDTNYISIGRFGGRRHRSAVIELPISTSGLVVLENSSDDKRNGQCNSQV